MTSAREVIAAKALSFVKDVLRDYDVPEDAFRGDPELAESCNLLADEVDARIAEAVAKERERCARIADHRAAKNSVDSDLLPAQTSDPDAARAILKARTREAEHIAAAIRGADHDE